MLPPSSFLSLSFSTQAEAKAEDRKLSSLKCMDQMMWRVPNLPLCKEIPHLYMCPRSLAGSKCIPFELLYCRAA